jgi:murein DD-endopeptidase MepM/ murein hydrolase activator NlpD
MSKLTVTALIAFIGFSFAISSAAAAGCRPDTPNAASFVTAAGPGNPKIQSASPTAKGHSVELKSGQSLASVLNELKVSAGEAHEAFKALSAEIELARLPAGQVVEVCVEPSADDAAVQNLVALSLPHGKRTVITASRSEDGGFQATKIVAPTEKAVVRASGVISSSLFAAAGRAGVPDAVIVQLMRAYSWDVDFQRDIRTGDRFEILYQQYVDEAGELVDTGDVLYAQLILRNKAIPVYRFEAHDGSVEYYAPNGKSVRKGLLRTPVDGARISSRFGMRKHPILGYTKMHQGIDFAAPRGTPIYAAGDGKIEFLGRRGGYGKYIRIRHDSIHSTAYAHLNSYRKGMRVGKSVKQGQVIGYVGTTGRSTGPHLHYEVLKSGRQINPARMKSLAQRELRGKDFAQFEKHVAKMDRLLAVLPTNVVKSDSQDAS